LDTLTFLPWRDVISQNELSIATRGQFCPECLAGDVVHGQVPYFRLVWEAAEVTVCGKHGCPLTAHCPHCGKDNIRHAAAFVVPGWKTLQIGELVAAQANQACFPTLEGLINAITFLIGEMEMERQHWKPA
jgi:hypothetical protein